MPQQCTTWRILSPFSPRDLLQVKTLASNVAHVACSLLRMKDMRVKLCGPSHHRNQNKSGPEHVRRLAVKPSSIQHLHTIDSVGESKSANPRIWKTTCQKLEQYPIPSTNFNASRPCPLIPMPIPPDPIYDLKCINCAQSVWSCALVHIPLLQ